MLRPIVFIFKMCYNQSTTVQKGIFMLKKLVGDRAFYKKVVGLMIPIMIQTGITNFVNMLDNVMVGRVGTNAMTGVAVANQLIFVFNLCVFGAISGAGIFTAQFFGNGDIKGAMHTFRFKVIFCSLLTIVGISVFAFKGEALMRLYLSDEANAVGAAETLALAKRYMMIMLIGLLPYAISQCYGGTLREAGRPTIPMIAGILAVIVNLTLNYVLIFGKLGAPRLGVAGAAIATVISRFAELLFLIIYTFIKSDKCRFILDGWKSPFVPWWLIKEIFKKGMPLMLNEALWSMGIALINQCYSVRGMDVVAATNISQTFFNVFAVAFMSVGGAMGIILGHTLGSGKTEEAMSTATKLIAFSVFVSIIVGAVYIVAARYIPYMYNTSDDVRYIAMRLMQITALVMPIDAFAHATYFTLRSGGKVFMTLLFDSCFIWIISVPVALLLVHFTSMGILGVYLCVQLVNLLKCVLGFIFVKRGGWVKNIVAEPNC